ncbi:MAG: dipeptide epimerase [Maricaulaceae bacterium]
MDTPALSSPQISCAVESWPVAGTFRISRSTIDEIFVVKVTITDGPHQGFGECRPYARYDETPQSVTAQIESLISNAATLTAQTLQGRLPAGAARNAVDCALWDLAVQKTKISISSLLNLPEPKPCRTAFTLSIDSPINMQKAALNASKHSLLKIKIGDMSGLEACLAVMHVRPDAELIIDANEALSIEDAKSFTQALETYPVVMIEQPIPAGLTLPARDAASLPVICADESLHTSADLAALWDQGYRAVNVKLDKTGGLTEAVNLLTQARKMGFVVMLGCMVGTSLAMAPAMYLNAFADIIDLDGALLLAKDREHKIIYEGDQIMPPPRALWGQSRNR